MPLVQHPVGRIVAAVADAAERWRDADFPPRVRALARIVERTGYAGEVVEYALDRLFQPLTRDALTDAITSELGRLEVLDRFVARDRLPALRAVPIGRVCVISSRTTIGVGLWPALFAICAKCSVVVKDREDALIAAFFATLADELDAIGDALVAMRWEGAAGSVDLHAFDAVVAFGSDAGIASIGRALAPTARFIAHPGSLSAGYLEADAAFERGAAAALAESIARDVLLYDTEGCLSLGLLFIERGGALAPQQWAHELAGAFARVTIEFPPGAHDPAARARVAQARDAAAVRASGGSGAVFSDPGANALIVLDPPKRLPPALLPRTLEIHAVDAPSEVAEYLAAHRLRLQALATVTARADVTAMGIDAGATRIAAFGALQAPALGDRHGGRPRIADFVRWVTRDA